MAKAEQIEALIRCHADGDDTRFYAMAIGLGSGRVRAWRGLSLREV